MIEEAGELAIPFTTGILVGIGETRRERVESLLAIRALHRALRPHPGGDRAELHAAPGDRDGTTRREPDDVEMAHAVAMARLILDPDVSLQAPPNLNPARTALLLARGHQRLRRHLAGHARLHQPAPPVAAPRARSRARCAAQGFALRPRLPIYERYLRRARLPRAASSCRSSQRRAARLAALRSAATALVAVASAARDGSAHDAGARDELAASARAPHGRARRRARSSSAASQGGRLALDRRGRGSCSVRGRGPPRADRGRRPAAPRAGRRRASRYVVNRNINFTNVCVKACKFCAFSRTEPLRGGLLPRHRRDRAPRARGAGDRRDRGVHPGRPAAARAAARCTSTCCAR